MKIDLDEWADNLSASLVTSGLKKNEATKVLKTIRETVDTKLICKSCGMALPDADFYVQSSNPARRHRGTHCKGCFRKAYPLR